MKTFHNLFLLFTIVSSLCSLIFAEDKEFAIIITSYNNAPWYEKNLESIFNQKYKNYRVIYVDDASTDGTADLVEKFVKKHKQQHRFTLIRNSTWQSQMANHYKAAHMCKDNEIIVHIDGDDWLLNPYVLTTLNKIYNDSYTWLTYGQNTAHTCRQLTPEQILHTDRRQIPLENFTHLRTFYAWLFKQIKLQDLMLWSSFKTTAPSPDVFFMYPLIEMAGKHSRFISDVIYYWNGHNPLSQAHIKKPEWKTGSDFFEWPLYSALKSPIDSFNQQATYSADLLVLLENPENLTYLINSICQNIEHVNKILVLLQNRTPETDIVYTVNTQATNLPIELCACPSECNIDEFLQKMLNTKVTKKHCVVMTDSVAISAPIKLSDCIKELEKTGAYGFYLSTSKEQFTYGIYTVPHAEIAPDTLAWHFKHGDYLWQEPKTFNDLYKPEHLTYIKTDKVCSTLKNPYDLTMTLYRTADFNALLKECTSKDYTELKQQLIQLSTDTKKVGRTIGLCFQTKKVIPLT